jgi:RecG-like helicase
MKFIAKEMARGGRVYWVCPVIEESEKLPLMPVIRRHEILAERFPEEKVGILHGQISPEEREETMEAFAGGDISILVSTTVVEVGLDVSEATVMVVEDAHRFGISQLHQLRGSGEGQFGRFLFSRGKAGYRRRQGPDRSHVFLIGRVQDSREGPDPQGAR